MNPNERNDISKKDLMKILKHKNYYDDSKYVPKHGKIIKCIKYHDGIPYQIDYYDFSRNWLKDEFDIKTYLKSLFVEDYYSNSGYLQWNFYLILLYNSDDVVDSKRIRDIERNDDFARKFIINYKDLDNWLNAKYRFYSEEDVNINEDLGILWMNRLEEENLDCVYLRDLNIQEGVENYGFRCKKF